MGASYTPITKNLVIIWNNEGTYLQWVTTEEREQYETLIKHCSIKHLPLPGRTLPSNGLDLDHIADSYESRAENQDHSLLGYFYSKEYPVTNPEFSGDDVLHLYYRWEFHCPLTETSFVCERDVASMRCLDAHVLDPPR